MLYDKDFSYKIVATDIEKDFMEATCTFRNGSTISVGTHLPEEGVDLGMHISRYIPLETVKPRTYVPSIGQTGSYNYENEKQKLDQNMQALGDEQKELQKKFIKDYLIELGIIK